MQNGKYNNVNAVINDALCSGCGACAGICPVHAITMKRNPAGFLIATVDEKKCIACNQCLKICTGYHENAKKLVCSDWANGRYIGAYIGHSTNPQERQKSQSGGAVSAILRFLLEQHKVDGVTVTGYDSKTGLTMSSYVEDPALLKQYCGSYYTQSNVVEEVLKHRDKKQAVVTVGCQSQSLRLLEEIQQLERPEYVIGLSCERQFSINFIKEFSQNKKISNIRFRDKDAGGWPGDVLVQNTDGTQKIISRERRVLLNDYYTNYRCTMCFDMSNQNADIVCGDPWFVARKKGMESMRKGETVILVRNCKGEKLVLDAAEAGYLQVEKTDAIGFLDENNAVYDKVGRTLQAQAAIKKMGFPNVYKCVEFENLLDERYKSASHVSFYKYYKRLCRHSYYNVMSPTYKYSKKLIAKEKCKNILRVGTVKLKLALRKIRKVI